MRETPDERNQRFHMDSVMWDPRPPHYNPSAPMNYAHLTVLGGEFAQEDPRGAPRISPWKTKSQAMTTIDDFQGAPSAAPSAAPSSAPSSFLDQKISMRSVLLLILIIVVAMVLMVRAANSSTAECRVRLICSRLFVLFFEVTGSLIPINSFSIKGAFHTRPI